MALLDVSDVTVRYGGITAVGAVSVSVNSSDIAVVTGANGAGKTSLLRSIAGLERKVEGTVTFAGHDITRWRPNRICRAGIVLVPEGRRIFSPLSVQDNLLIGAYAQASRRERDSTLADIYDRFPILAERRQRQAGLLSGGEQQMLAFGRALMSSPKLMMMDEPSMGLAPVAVDVVMTTVQTIAASGIGVLMVEQNASMVRELATSAIVLERGEVISFDSTGATSLSSGALTGLDIELISDSD